MQITRRFTREGQDPFAGIAFALRTSKIVNPNGSVVFEMKDVMAPAGWSQVAVDILAQKYFRRAGEASGAPPPRRVLGALARPPDVHRESLASTQSLARATGSIAKRIS